MTEQPRADAVVTVYPFKAQVAIFRDFDTLRRYYEQVIGISDHRFGDRPANAMASEHQDDSGANWWSLFLPDDVQAPTVVHECSHIVDFMMETHGVPMGVENTEIRAYMLAALFEEVTAALSGQEATA